MFEHGFLPWINDHLFAPPPPTDNDRVVTIMSCKRFDKRKFPSTPCTACNHEIQCNTKNRPLT